MNRIASSFLFLLAFIGSVVYAHEDNAIHNTIKWSTSSEVDNFGFDVFRADSETGPFKRVNDSTVSGAGTSDIPQSYEFIDWSIEPGRKYWYYVESISMSGTREKFTPTFQSRAKRSSVGN